MAATEQHDDLSVAEASTSIEWFGARPTSMNHLADAEGKVLQYVRSNVEGFYVPISNNRRIWTIKVDTQKSDALPIVMIHGFASAVGFWLLNIDAIAEHRAVYAFDFLGFGRSSRPKFSEDASTVEEEFVNSIEEWRDSIGLEEFILLGFSFGGFIAASYSIKYPDRVKHLILAEPWGMDRVQQPLWRNVVAAVQNQLFSLELPLVRAAGPWGPWLMKIIRPDLRARSASLFQDDRFLDYTYHCNAQRPSGETVYSTIQSLGQAKNPIIPRITQLRQDVPITYICGAQSWLNQLENEAWKRLQILREGSYVKVYAIDGAGHEVFLDKPEEFNRLMVQVCEETDRAQKSENIGL